jgi:dipeptidyl aminopeptidase/acylaminoacyl peptidase
VALALAVSQPGARPFDVETAVGLVSVREAVLDPTGRHVAYVLSVPREADDEPGTARAELWVTTVEGGPPRRFSPPGTSATSPRWAPDGGAIAYLARADDDADDGDDADRDVGATQIHVIPIDGGSAEALTAHPTSVTALRWAPDGDGLAFTASDETSDAEREDEDAGRDWVVVGDDDAFQRLWLVDAGTGVTRSLHDEPLHVGAFTWTPDGSTIVMVASGTTSVDDAMMSSRIYRLPLADGRPAAPEVVCRTPGKLGDLAVSPGSHTLAFLGATSRNDPLPQNVFVTPLDGSAPRLLTDGLEASATAIAWMDDRTLVMLADEGTRTTLRRIDAATGRGRTILDGADGPVLRSFSVRDSLARFCAVGETPAHPAEVFVGTLDGARLDRLTDHNPVLASLRLAPMETIEWRSADGLRVEGVLTRPAPDVGAPAPLVVHPHGGPEAASQHGWSPLVQLLAARGYAVLQPNYRGSAGRGVAFSRGDHDDLGGQEFQDILSGVDALIERGLVDPDRVGMGGWSYGGYLSAMAATHHSPRFRAAVMGAGISNWVSFTGTTDIPEEMSVVHWNRPMSENVALYWERSPLAAIDRAATPTLILFGAGDERVPPGQGHELHHALRDRGVATEMVLYPRAGHGIRERAHLVDLYTRQLDWFDEHLR